MTQTAEFRRLVRLAASMNRKAARIGARGRVSPQQLEFIERTQANCQYCGVQLPVQSGTFDHVRSFAETGRNDWTNLVRCCLSCNRSKFTKSPAQLQEHRERTVVCARPGCGNTYKPRWAEWQAGRARLCSRRCAALWRYEKPA